MSTVKAKDECNQAAVDRVFTETYFDRCMRLEARNEARRGSYHQHFIDNMHHSINTCGAPWCQSNMHYASIDEDGFPFGPVFHCPKWMRVAIPEFKLWEIEYSNIPF